MEKGQLPRGGCGLKFPFSDGITVDDDGQLPRGGCGLKYGLGFGPAECLYVSFREGAVD